MEHVWAIKKDTLRGNFKKLLAFQTTVKYSTSNKNTQLLTSKENNYNIAYLNKSSIGNLSMRSSFDWGKFTSYNADKSYIYIINEWNACEKARIMGDRHFPREFRLDISINLFWRHMTSLPSAYNRLAILKNRSAQKQRQTVKQHRGRSRILDWCSDTGVLWQWSSKIWVLTSCWTLSFRGWCHW